MAADPKPPALPDESELPAADGEAVADQDDATGLPIDEAGDADGQPI